MSQIPLENEPLADVLLEEKVDKPKLYKVLLHNDDYTTMDFVVHILMRIFQKSFEDSTTIMLSVHQEGIGVCGVYAREIAEYRVTQTMYLAREAGFPLLCTMELA